MARGNKIVTPPFRVSFPAVFEKRGFEGSEPKFSVCAVFDPSSWSPTEAEAFQALKQIAEDAAKDKFNKGLSGNPALRSPFRDGAEKAHLEGFGEGLIFCTLSSKMKPGLIDRDRQPIIDEEDFYAGCYARATVTAYGYSNVSKGVGLGLHNLQKLGDGENLTGRIAAENDFESDAPVWGDVDPVGSGTEDDPLL